MATYMLSSKMSPIIRLLLKEQSYSSRTICNGMTEISRRGYSTDGDALQPAAEVSNAAAAYSGPLEHYTNLDMDWALREDPHHKAVVQTSDKMHKTLRGYSNQPRFSKNIVLVSHLLSIIGNLFTLRELMERYNFEVSSKEYDTVIKSIPCGVKYLLQNNAYFGTYIVSDIQRNGVGLLDKKFNNLLLKDIFYRKSIPSAIFCWASSFDVNWRRAWLIPHIYGDQ